MNWEMIGAVGEILGAAGVIATLAYLARQIRSSTQATRRAAMQEVLDQTGYFLDALGSTPEAAAAWAKGLTGDDSLSLEQKVQFRLYAYRWTIIMERFYHMAEAGELDPWIIENNRRIRRDMVAFPGYQAWYEHQGHWHSDGFRAVLEQDMAIGSDAPVASRPTTPEDSSVLSST